MQEGREIRRPGPLLNASSRQTCLASNLRRPLGAPAHGLLHLPPAPPSGKPCDDAAGAKEEQECGNDEADEFQRQPTHRLAVYRLVRGTPGQTSEQDHPEHSQTRHCATPNRRTRPIKAAARLTPAKGIEGTQSVGAAVRSEDCQRRSLRGDAAAHSKGVTVGRRAMITDSRVAAERARGARRCPTGLFSTTAGIRIAHHEQHGWPRRRALLDRLVDHGSVDLRHLQGAERQRGRSTGLDPRAGLARWPRRSRRSSRRARPPHRLQDRRSAGAPVGRRRAR